MGAVSDAGGGGVDHWLTGCGAVRTFPRNAVVALEGATADCFFYIVAGRVRVMVTSGARDRPLVELGPNDSFGEAVIADGRYRATYRCAARTAIHVVPKVDLDAKLATDPAFARALALQLEHEVGRLKLLVRQFALQRVEQRIRDYVLGLRNGGDHALAPMPRMTQRDIAANVGASPSMVSRVLKDIERAR